MKIGTYNIRIQVPKDKGNKSWCKRKGLISRLIHENDLDIISVQEIGNTYQKWSLEYLLSDYLYYGKGLQWLGIVPASECGIFYKADKFELKDNGYFWLSETKWKYSKSWDAAFPKTCVWVKLLDKTTNKEFYVISTHFDHIGHVARVESAKLVSDFIKHKVWKLPVLFMGDLNTSIPMNEGVLEILSENMTECVNSKEVINLIGTGNGYTNEFPNAIDRIDFIYTKGVDMLKVHVDNTLYRGIYPSDHFPVILNFEIK